MSDDAIMVEEASKRDAEAEVSWDQALTKTRLTVELSCHQPLFRCRQEK